MLVDVLHANDQVFPLALIVHVELRTVVVSPFAALQGWRLAGRLLQPIGFFFQSLFDGQIDRCINGLFAGVDRV